MARRLDGFTRAFSDSKIPFLLAEVITDGQGEMVDLTCRYLNGAAAALAGQAGLLPEMERGPPGSQVRAAAAHACAGAPVHMAHAGAECAVFIQGRQVFHGNLQRVFIQYDYYNTKKQACPPPEKGIS